MAVKKFSFILFFLYAQPNRNISVISIKRQINRLINGESRQQSSLLQQ